MIDVAETELLTERAGDRRPGRPAERPGRAADHQRQPGDAGRTGRLDRAPVRLRQPRQLPRRCAKARRSSVPIQESLLPASFAVASYRASLLPLLGDPAEASLQGADRRNWRACRCASTPQDELVQLDDPHVAAISRATLSLNSIRTLESTSTMNDDAQILIARLLTHQTLRRDDKMVKRALSDDTVPRRSRQAPARIGPEAARQRLRRPRHAGPAPQRRAEDLRRQGHLAEQ